jgi:Zn-dependent M28 family amino/carboxypeptidase
VAHSQAPNVICTLPGTGDGVIVVGAHFDYVDSGSGVVDNWSGASLLPSLYQSLSENPRTHTFVFLGFTDEEKGFVGSKAYIAGLRKEEIARIQGMIDIDTLGLGPTEIWVNNSDPGLVKQLSNLAWSMKLPVSGMNVDGVGDSDGHFFKYRGIPIITLHSVTSETLSILHSGRDNFGAIKFNDYYDSYKLIAAYLVLLDSSLGGSPK